jgi:hypothetical protein
MIKQALEYLNNYEGIYGAIIYYAVEKELLWPTAYKYGEPLLNKEAES